MVSAHPPTLSRTPRLGQVFHVKVHSFDITMVYYRDFPLRKMIKPNFVPTDVDVRFALDIQGMHSNETACADPLLHLGSERFYRVTGDFFFFWRTTIKVFLPDVGHDVSAVPRRGRIFPLVPVFWGHVNDV